MSSSHRAVASCDAASRCEVMWMKWPASCHARTASTAPGYGLAASTIFSPCVSRTHAFTCSGRSRVMSQVTWSS